MGLSRCSRELEIEHQGSHKAGALADNDVPKLWPPFNKLSTIRDLSIPFGNYLG